MHVLIQGRLLCGVVALSCAVNVYASDGRGACAALVEYGKDRKASLLQLGDQRHSLRTSVLQPSAGDPGKERQELMCYLKGKLQEAFKNAIKPLPGFGGGPFGRTLFQKRCAAVSSSGALLKNKYGPRIDATADVPFRFNDAPISGFEEHVGKFEGVRVGNQDLQLLLGNVNITPGAAFVLLDAQRNAALVEPLARAHPESVFYEYPFYLYEVVQETLQGIYSDRWLTLGKGRENIATTGSIGMFLALSFCGSVEAFEMAASDYANSTPYNYYGQHLASETAQDNAVHAFFQMEHDLWKRMSVNSTTEMAKTGRALISGFDSIDCTNVSGTPRYTSLWSDYEPALSVRRIWNLT